MYHHEDDTNSDMNSDDDMSRSGRETPPPRPSHAFGSERDLERRGRSRDVEPRDRWPYTRNPRSRLPQRDLSLPVMSRPHFGLDRDDDRRSMDYESRSQDAESYQNVVELKEDKKPQNPIQDNLENYRKLLSLGVQLAEEDHHTKVHKDEPYEYGPSYTHASFLTEPLRKHIPLYECKDCGQSFLDDTVIAERMVFHPEREGGSEIVAATAQEVEANVLIPQEVLRIQGSNAEAAEPEVEAAEPDGADIEDPEEEGEDQEIEVEEPYYNCHECAETFASSSAFGEHLKSHASVIIFEPANAPGECSGYIERASTSAGGAEQADDKYFKCDVCGQLFNDRLSLARHQNSHTG